MMDEVKSILNWFKSQAEQMTDAERWIMLLSVIFKWFLCGKLLGSTKKIPEGCPILGFG